jgi:uncharacterized protein YkvS
VLQHSGFGWDWNDLVRYNPNFTFMDALENRIRMKAFMVNKLMNHPTFQIEYMQPNVSHVVWDMDVFVQLTFEKNHKDLEQKKITLINDYFKNKVIPEMFLFYYHPSRMQHNLLFV